MDFKEAVKTLANLADGKRVTKRERLEALEAVKATLSAPDKPRQKPKRIEI